MQHEGPLIGQTDLSGDPRLNAIVERMEAAGYYSAEDIEAVRQSGEPLREGEREFVGQMGAHYDLMSDLRGVTGELAAESERRKAAFIAPEGAVQQGGPLIGQADLSGDPRLADIVERMKAAGYYSAEDIEAVRQSGEGLREGEREFVGQMGAHYDLLQDLREVTGELAAESDRRKAAYAAPEGPVQQGGPLIGQADLSGDPRLAGIVERMEAAGYYSAEDIEAVRQSGEPLREGEREFVTDLSVAADIAAETEAAKKAQERDMLLGGGHYGDTGAEAEQLAQWRHGGNVGDLAVGLDYDNQLRLAKPDELNDVSRLPETIYIDGIPHNLQEVLERNRFEDVGILQQLRKPVPYTELEIRSEPWLADPSKSRLVQQGDRTTSRQEENLAKYEEKLAQQNVTLKETLDGLLDSGRVSFNAPPDGPEIVEIRPPVLYSEMDKQYQTYLVEKEKENIEAFAQQVAELQAQGKTVVIKTPASLGNIARTIAGITIPGYDLTDSILSARDQKGPGGRLLLPNEENQILWNVAFTGLDVAPIPLGKAASVTGDVLRDTSRIVLPARFGGGYVPATTPARYLPRVHGTSPEVTIGSLNLRNQAATTGYAEEIIGDYQVRMQPDRLTESLRSANPDAPTITYHVTAQGDKFLEGGKVPDFPTKGIIEQGEFRGTTPVTKWMGTSAFGVAGNNPAIVVRNDPLDAMGIPGTGGLNPLEAATHSDVADLVKSFQGGREIEFWRPSGATNPAVNPAATVGDPWAGQLLLPESMQMPSYFRRLQANALAILDAHRRKQRGGVTGERLSNTGISDDDIARRMFGDEAVAQGLSQDQLRHVQLSKLNNADLALLAHTDPVAQRMLQQRMDVEEWFRAADEAGRAERVTLARPEPIPPGGGTALSIDLTSRDDGPAREDDPGRRVEGEAEDGGTMRLEGGHDGVPPRLITTPPSPPPRMTTPQPSPPRIGVPSPPGTPPPSRATTPQPSSRSIGVPSPPRATTPPPSPPRIGVPSPPRTTTPPPSPPRIGVPSPPRTTTPPPSPPRIGVPSPSRATTPPTPPPPSPQRNKPRRRPDHDDEQADQGSERPLPKDSHPRSVQYISKALVTVDLETGDEVSVPLAEPQPRIVEHSKQAYRNVTHEARNVRVTTDEQGKLKLHTISHRHRNPRREFRNQPPMVKPLKVGHGGRTNRPKPYTRGMLRKR